MKKTKKKQRKMGRVIIDLGYVVDLNDEEMVQCAKDAFYEDVMEGYKYDSLGSMIETIEDKKAKVKDIPGFLVGKD